MSGRFVLPLQSVYDSDGSAISGAKAYFYESGTSTPQNTYSDSALSVANTNPVVADSSGRFSDIFLNDNAYKFTLARSDDTIIYTADPVTAGESSSSDVTAVTTTTIVSLADANKLIAADATSGAFTVTLPTAASAGNGFEITVKKTDPSDNTVTLDADGTELIDGVNSVKLGAQYDAVTVRSTGAAWLRVNRPPAATYLDKIATTSGTSITLADDLGELAGATEVVISFDGVSNTTDGQPPIIRIGPSGGAVTSGYIGSSASINGATAAEADVTDGIYLLPTASFVATSLISGEITLTRPKPTENLWLISGWSVPSPGSARYTYVGFIALAGKLADIVLTTSGGLSTFDAGDVSIRYK